MSPNSTGRLAGASCACAGLLQSQIAIAMAHTTKERSALRRVSVRSADASTSLCLGSLPKQMLFTWKHLSRRKWILRFGLTGTLDECETPYAHILASTVPWDCGHSSPITHGRSGGDCPTTQRLDQHSLLVGHARAPLRSCAMSDSSHTNSACQTAFVRKAQMRRYTFAPRGNSGRVRSARILAICHL